MNVSLAALETERRWALIEAQAGFRSAWDRPVVDRVAIAAFKSGFLDNIKSCFCFLDLPLELQLTVVEWLASGWRAYDDLKCLE